MNLKHISYTVIAFAALSLGNAAAAAPITPTFSTFGTLTGATFGGSGIPNTAVAITTLAGSGTTLPPRLTLGLTAHQRFSDQPPLLNNGAGVFTALAGVSPTVPSTPANPLATWNFGWYVGGADLSNFVFELLYDLNPATGTQQANLRTLGRNPLAVLTQNSWNLGMDFLELPNVFDPTVNGEYSFALIAYGRDGNQLFEVARSAMLGNVTGGSNLVPTPGTLALAAVALLGLAGVSRRLS